MTQTGVAFYLGVTVRTVQLWLAGSVTPGGENIVALGRLLDRSPEWFFDTTSKEAA